MMIKNGYELLTSDNNLIQQNIVKLFHLNIPNVKLLKQFLEIISQDDISETMNNVIKEKLNLSANQKILFKVFYEKK